MRVRRAVRFLGSSRRSPPVRGQRGFVLIEALVSIAIFGVISVAFLGALVTGYRGVMVADDQTMAESLTRSTFEDIKVAAFPIDPAEFEKTTSNYDVEVTAEYVSNLDTYETTAGSTTFQLITVTIKTHDTGKTLLVTRDAKVQL